MPVGLAGHQGGRREAGDRQEWDPLRGFLPADPPRGGRWLSHRMVIDGIFFRTRTFLKH